MGKWQNFRDDSKRDKVRILNICGIILLVGIVNIFRTVRSFNEPSYANAAYTDAAYVYDGGEVSFIGRCLSQLEQAKEALSDWGRGLFGRDDSLSQEQESAE